MQKLRAVLIGLIAFAFLMLLQVPTAEAITRICFPESGQPVIGAVVTGPAVSNVRTITLSASKFYVQDVFLLPDKYWRFDHVQGFGVYTSASPFSYRDTNVRRSWTWFWTVSQGFITVTKQCTTNS